MANLDSGFLPPALRRHSPCFDWTRCCRLHFRNSGLKFQYSPITLPKHPYTGAAKRGFDEAVVAGNAQGHYNFSYFIFSPRSFSPDLAGWRRFIRYLDCYLYVFFRESLRRNIVFVEDV